MLLQRITVLRKTSKLWATGGFKKTTFFEERLGKRCFGRLKSDNGSRRTFGGEEKIISVDRSTLIYPGGAERSSLILPATRNSVKQKNGNEGSGKEDGKTDLTEREGEGRLLHELRELIKLRGPLSVAEYMQHCLGHPTHGYYKRERSQSAAGEMENDDMFGKSGDFITAPEISQLFGEMIGVWCVAVWEALDKPDRLKIVELGPGRGTLMKDILRTAANFPSFCEALEGGGINMVETSPALQERQRSTLSVTADGSLSVHSQKASQQGSVETFNIGIRWMSFFSEVIDAQKEHAEPTIVICQELFDALPIHQFVRRNDRWCERLVDIDFASPDLDLRFISSKGPTLASRLLLPGKNSKSDASDQDDLAEGSIVEVSPVSAALFQDVVQTVDKHTGALLIIDYGYGDTTSEAMSAQVKDSSSLRGIKDHSFVDPLSQPGGVDLSADVNFEYLKQNAHRPSQDVNSPHDKASKPIIYGPTTQAQFLSNLGIQQRLYALLQAETDEEKQLELFAGYKRLVEGEAEEEGKGGMGQSYKAMAVFKGKGAGEKDENSTFPGF